MVLAFRCSNLGQVIHFHYKSVIKVIRCLDCAADLFHLDQRVHARKHAQALRYPTRRWYLRCLSSKKETNASKWNDFAMSLTLTHTTDWAKSWSHKMLLPQDTGAWDRKRGVHQQSINIHGSVGWDWRVSKERQSRPSCKYDSTQLAVRCHGVHGLHNLSIYYRQVARILSVTDYKLP